MNQSFNRTINHSLICIILQLMQNMFTFLGLSKWIYHGFKDGIRLSNVKSLRCYPQNNYANHKNQLFINEPDLCNSLWTSSKILSAFLFGLFIQSTDPCGPSRMIFLSKAPRFLALKMIKTPGKRSLIQILLTQEWILGV